MSLSGLSMRFSNIIVFVQNILTALILRCQGGAAEIFPRKYCRLPWQRICDRIFICVSTPVLNVCITSKCLSGTSFGVSNPRHILGMLFDFLLYLCNCFLRYETYRTWDLKLISLLSHPDHHMRFWQE